MSFEARIEADNGAEILSNLHPDGKRTSGKAVFAFLSGLQTLCYWTASDNSTSLVGIVEWYRRLETSANVQLCSTCRPLLDCMWGDGGDHTEYHQTDYEFYKHRGGGSQISEADFLKFIQDTILHWQPIDKVIGAIQLLLTIFQNMTVEPLEGFFHPEDSRADFEALYANLKLLSQRGAQTIRLNFS